MPVVRPRPETGRGGARHDPISVVLCTYNGEKYVAEQLASIFHQTTLPEEVIVRDDGSRDDTIGIIRGMVPDSPCPVRLAVNPSRLGSTGNFAAAIAESSGDLIALSDQDDVWEPTKLERLAAALSAAPEAGAAFSDALVVDEDLRPLGYTLWDAARFDRRQREQIEAGRAVDVLVRNQVVTGATLMFRSSYRDLLLPFPEAVVHDAWIALVIGIVSRLIPIGEPLVRYRQHGANQIGVRRTRWWGRARRKRGDAVPYLPAALARYGAARARLHDEPRCPGGILDLLSDAEEHLRVRTALPERPVDRARAVLREIRLRRYSRYSSGMFSVIEDLL